MNGQDRSFQPPGGPVGRLRRDTARKGTAPSRVTFGRGSIGPRAPPTNWWKAGNVPS